MKMKMKLPHGILALFIFTCAPPVYATNLLDLFLSAVENDPELKAAQFSQKIGNEAKPLALSKMLPTLSMSGRAGKASHDVRESSAETGTEKQISNDINASIVLTQPVFNLATLREQTRADIIQSQAALNYRIAQQALIYRVANTYFTTLSYTDRLNYARAERNQIAKIVKTVESRFDTDEAEAFEVLEAQSRHNVALAREIKYESELVTQRGELMRLTGTAHNNLQPVKESAPLIPPMPASMEDWTDAAKNQSLLIAVKKLDAELVKQELSIIRASRYPTVDLNASYGFNEYGGAYPQKSVDARITLDFNMALFDGNKSSAQIRSNQHVYKRIIHEIEAKEREIRQSTRTAYLGILTGISYVKALDRAIDSGEQALRAITKGFDKGEKSAIDVLNVQQQFFKNKQEYATSRYQYILSTLKLKQNVGTLSIDDLEQVNTWLN